MLVLRSSNFQGPNYQLIRPETETLYCLAYMLVLRISNFQGPNYQLIRTETETLYCLAYTKYWFKNIKLQRAKLSADTSRDRNTLLFGLYAGFKNIKLPKAELSVDTSRDRNTLLFGLY